MKNPPPDPRLAQLLTAMRKADTISVTEAAAEDVRRAYAEAHDALAASVSARLSEACARLNVDVDAVDPDDFLLVRSHSVEQPFPVFMIATGYHVQQRADKFDEVRAAFFLVGMNLTIAADENGEKHPAFLIHARPVEDAPATYANGTPAAPGPAAQA